MKPRPPRRHHRRHNGKVARLPEATREHINAMIEDGFTYRRIIQALGPPGTPPLPHAISEMNLSNWFRGGYKDWVRRQENLEFQRAHPFPRPDEPPSVRNFLQLLRARRTAAAQPHAPAFSNEPRAINP